MKKSNIKLVHMHLTKNNWPYFLFCWKERKYSYTYVLISNYDNIYAVRNGEIVPSIVAFGARTQERLTQISYEQTTYKISDRNLEYEILLTRSPFGSEILASELRRALGFHFSAQGPRYRSSRNHLIDYMVYQVLYAVSALPAVEIVDFRPPETIPEDFY